MISPNILRRGCLLVLCMTLIGACGAHSSVPTARPKPTASTTGANPASPVAGPSSSGATGPPSSAAEALPSGGFAPSSRPAAPGHLVALDALTGRQRWRTQLPMATISTPLVAGDLVVVGGTDDCKSNRLTVAGLRTATGQVVWRASVPVAMPCSYPPRVLLAGDVVVAGDGLGATAGTCPLSTTSKQRAVGQTAALVGLDVATGRQRWRAPAAVAMTLGTTADLALTSTGGSCLVALDSRTGRVRWSRPLPLISPDVVSSPAGTFLEGQLPAAREQLMRIDPANGATKWTTNLPRGWFGPMVALTNTVTGAVQIETGGLPPPSLGAPSAVPAISIPPTTVSYAITSYDSASGRELWRVSEPGQSSVTGGPGLVLVSDPGQQSDPGRQSVDALDPRTGHQLWASPIATGEGASTITDGTTVLLWSGGSMSALKAADGTVRWSVRAVAAADGTLVGTSAYLTQPGTPHNPSRGG